MALERRVLFACYNFFGISPFYDFKKKKLTKQKWNKVWIVLIICHQMVGFYVSAKGSARELDDRHLKPTVKFLRISTSYSYSSTTILLPTIHLFTGEKWGHFLQRLQRIDILVPTTTKKNMSTLINVTLLHVIFIENLIFDTFEFITADSWYLVYFWIAEDVYFLYLQISLTFIIDVVNIKFERLNQMLMEQVSAAAEYRSVYIDQDNGTIAKIKNIKNLHKDLTDLVKDADDLFEWPVILVTHYIILSSLNALNFFILHGAAYWGEMVDLANIMVFMVCLIMSCDFASAEGMRIINLSHKLEGKFGIATPIRLELLKIGEYVRYRRPVFTLLGVIDLNRRALLIILSCLAKYLIIVIQFNTSL